MAAAPQRRHPGAWAAPVLAAVAVAAAVCIGLALNTSRHSSSEPTGAWSHPCGTGSARQHRGLAGVCLPDAACHEEACCPPANGSQQWFAGVPPGDLALPDHLASRWVENASLTSGVDVVTVACAFSSIDFSFYAATLACDLQAWGRFDRSGRFAARARADGLGNQTAPPVLLVQLNAQEVRFAQGDSSWKQAEVKVSFRANPYSTQGAGGSAAADAQHYPYVALPFSLLFAARWLDESNGSFLAGVDEPPVVVVLEFSPMTIYTMSGLACDSTSYPDGLSYYSVSGIVALSAAVHDMVNSLNACMWLLAAMTVAMSLVWVALAKPKDRANFDLVGFSTALLFALPAMRNLLTAAAPAGSMYDVRGLNIYGQLWLVAISIMLQVLKFFFSLVNEERHLVASSVLSAWLHAVCDACEHVRKTCACGAAKRQSKLAMGAPSSHERQEGARGV